MNNSSTIRTKQEQNSTEENIKDSVGRIYRASGNLLIIKDCYKAVPKQFQNCIRSAIAGFSPGALIRMRRYLRECMADYRQMVTLTYPCGYPSNGREVKEHLRRFNQELRREYIRTSGDDGMHSIFWFLEFQERGAPHFHLFCTWAPDKKWIASTWYRIVNSEDTRHLHAGTRVEFLHSGRGGTLSYASKYAAKQHQKDVPENYQNVGRFWGVSGRRHVMSADTFVHLHECSGGAAQKACERLNNDVLSAIKQGKAEVIVSDNGVRVVSFNDLSLMPKIRNRVMLIACSVMRFSQVFCDAEIELGEGMDCA